MNRQLRQHHRNRQWPARRPTGCRRQADVYMPLYSYARIHLSRSGGLMDWNTDPDRHEP